LARIDDLAAPPVSGASNPAAAVPAGGGLVVVKVAPFNAEAGLDRLGAQITPTPSFYVRSNFAVPQLEPDRHAIGVEGAVERPLRLSPADLHALPIRTVTTTMECAGNNRSTLAPLPSGEPWQAGAVSAARWTGVALRDVLDRAGVQGGTIEVLAEGADRGTPKDGPADIPFARSLPLDKAMHPDTLLALEMNDAPLPPDHGAPVRLVVPEWYGMASVKWLARIVALTEPFTGYYQARRYIYDHGGDQPVTPVTRMRVKSVIVSPAEGSTVAAGTVVVQGKAWSGDGAIVKVEVAVDGGDTWQEARLLEDGGAEGQRASYTWRAWEFVWQASDPGRHALRARATDSAGNRQPDAARWNKYGYGNNAARPVMVMVRG
jgi:DMSO/TMAO reductase YedYZ molybdopterin-dependent catalytic subunit